MGMEYSHLVLAICKGITGHLAKVIDSHANTLRFVMMVFLQA
jgi:hypothetical protein